MQNKSEVAGHIKVGIIILVVIVIIQYYTVRVNRQNFCIFIIACVRLGHVDLHADCLNIGMHTHRMHQENLQGAGHVDQLIQCRLVMEKGMLSKITTYIH